MSVNETVEQIFSLISTGDDACQYISEQLNIGSTDGVSQLLDDLGAMLESIITSVEDFDLNKNFIKNVILNAQDYLNKVNTLISIGNIRKAQIDFDFVFYGLYVQLYNELHSHLIVLASDENFKEYWSEQFAKLDDARKSPKYLKQKDKKYKYKASIFVPAYNSKEYTKECIESIYKYTDGIGTDYELITRSDGSTDGVDEYLESLDNEKKLIYKHNILFMNSLLYAVEGEYIVYVSNDVVVTHNWIENLMKCIESDETIGMVVPTTNNLSNIQTVPVDYKDMNEMQEFAKSYNVSDKRKW